MLRATSTFLAGHGRRGAASASTAASAPTTLKAQQAAAAAAAQHQQLQQQQQMPAITPTIAAAAFKQLEHQMVRSFRLDQVLSQVSANDIIVARQDVSRYSFIGFKDISALDVSRSLLLVPEHMRHFHTVCARENAPCDFYADIDLPQEADGEETLLQVTDRLHAKLAAINFGAFDTIILESKHRHKQSYHLHARGHTSAFSDFRAVRAIADTINTSMGSPVVDMSCYRYNGTLRTAFCSKMVAPTSATSGSIGTQLVSHLLPMQPRDAELARRLSGMQQMAPEQLFEASLINRQIPTESFPYTTPLRLVNGYGKNSKLSKVLAGEAGAGRDGMTEGAHRFLREDVKWLRYTNAIKKLRQLPSSAAEDYQTWISVGLALHSFGSESHILEEWMKFSARCPEKYSRDVCQSRWLQFDSTSDAGNWRRGYNYLTSTVWRQFGADIPTDSHRPRM